MLEAGLIVSRFAHYTAMLALFGGALFPLYAGKADAPMAASWSRPWAVAAGLLGLFSGMAWFSLTTATMAGDPASALDPTAMWTVVSSTDFGPLWLTRLVLILVVLWLVCARPVWPPRWSAALIAGLALAALAGTGHARVPDGWRGIVHVLTDGAHLLAAGAWLGGLWPLGSALAIAASTAGTEDDYAVAAILERFSGVGFLVVGTLVLTGTVSGFLLIGSIGAALASSYGLLLMGKIAIFFVMVLLAAANRFWITPALASGRSLGDVTWLIRIRRHVLLEQALGVAVVIVVSLLGTMQPPGLA